MHREYEHDDVRVTDLWLFGLTLGACRLTATPGVEESNVSWLDDRHVIFRIEPSGMRLSRVSGRCSNCPHSQSRRADA